MYMPHWTSAMGLNGQVTDRVGFETVTQPNVPAY
jgi:hypothetical protein